MPMLKRNGVSTLLSTFNKGSSAQSRQKTNKRLHYSLPDVDPDADPLSTSESENADSDLILDVSPDAGLGAGHNSWTTATPTQRQTLSRRKTASLTSRGAAGSLSKNPTNLSRGGPRTGQKRKREAHSATVDLVNAENELEVRFDGIDSQGEKRKNKRQYGKRHQSLAILNLHASPVSDKHAVVLSKHPRAGFKKPDDIDACQDGSDKKAFNAPMPLQDHSEVSDQKSSVGARFRMTFLTSSQPLSCQTFGSSEPSAEASSVLSSPPASETLDSTQEHFDQQLATLEALNSPPSSPGTSSARPTVALCPMCKTEVELDYLLSFSKGKKLRLKEAMDFCREHKQRSLESDWNLSKYPPINWSILNKRLRKFNDKLDEILDRRTSSVYWKELEEKVASGKSRNALRNPEAENGQILKASTGYYGGKGARRIVEHIMARFANKIRALAAKERLFTEVGVGGFVQAVLVPELVLMLVMEDHKGCDAPTARQIVAESSDTGELMNEEEEERIEEKKRRHGETVAQVVQTTNLNQPGDKSLITLE